MPVEEVERCPRCRMVTALCYCAEISAVPTRTRITLVLHAMEQRKSSNSGRLVSYALSNSEILVHGRKDEILNTIAAQGYAPYVLHPDGASTIDSPSFLELALLTPIQLIVPDGNWGQASRMVKRIPGLQNLPMVRLPRGRGVFRLRKNPDPERMGTMEAIARALEILEGPEVRVHCEDAIRVLADRLGKTARVPVR